MTSEEQPPLDIEVGECSDQPQQHSEFSVPPSLGESDNIRDVTVAVSVSEKELVEEQ